MCTGTHDEVSMPDVDDVEGCQDCEGVVRSRRKPRFRGGVRHATNPTHIINVARAFSLWTPPAFASVAVEASPALSPQSILVRLDSSKTGRPVQELRQLV